jgi:hypothetical protein
VLSPYGFFPRALAAQVVAHIRQQAVGIIKTAANTEEEGREDAVCDD